MLIPLLKGLATYVPGLYRSGRGSTGGSISARYCYAVWMRHLAMARESGLGSNFEVVAELGPGDSLGMGLAALLSGARSYYAFDIVPYTRNDRNLRVLHELVELFSRRESIPDHREFPQVRPRLEYYSFLHDVLTGDRLEGLIADERVERIESALRDLGDGQEQPIHIRYYAPWQGSAALREGSVDFLFSQAVLEHIDDLDGTYRTMHRWLRPNGILSHQIDFRAHYLDERWNAHWTYSDLTWKLIRGRRPYLLNRQPLSTHLSCLERAGFEVVLAKRHKRDTAVQRRQLATRFRDLSDDDLTTSGVFLQARKIPAASS